MELDRLDWLSLRNEEAFDPLMRIVDPHHHLWNRGGSRYLAEELREDTLLTHNVTNTVFVECKANYDREVSKEFQPIGETVFVADEASRLAVLGGPKISGIVSFADLSLGRAVTDVLQAHDDASNGLFRGVRHATAWSDDPQVSISHTKPTKEIMKEGSFHEGVSVLGEFGYTFDAWLYFNQLSELVDLARACPGVQIVLNHLGAPLAIGDWETRYNEVDEIWKSQMIRLANCENVALKIGGIGMDNYFKTGWATLPEPPDSKTVADFWKDRINWCIDLFTPKRCMFESNFPVDRQTLTYSVLWNSFQRITESYEKHEREFLFSRTACEIYKIV
jgi:predicted TIM-barrel fold metal-dependent hydrolase